MSCIHSAALSPNTFLWNSFSCWVPVECGCSKGVWTLIHLHSYMYQNPATGHTRRNHIKTDRIWWNMDKRLAMLWTLTSIHALCEQYCCPCTHHEGMCGSSNIDPFILNLGTRWGELSASCPSCFTLRIHWIGGRAVHTASLNGLEKIKTLALAGNWITIPHCVSSTVVTTPTEIMWLQTFSAVWRLRLVLYWKLIRIVCSLWISSGSVVLTFWLN
jgi:hypothetical protein